MAINLANNNSLANITALPSSISGGGMTLISEQTASSSATIDFTSGIDDTYDSYVFKFINIHPSADSTFGFQTSTNGGSSYGVTATTTNFRAYHIEDGAEALFGYLTSYDLAQSTSDVTLAYTNSSDADNGCCGLLNFFSPNSSTFVKHFTSDISTMRNASPDASIRNLGAGYFNTTSAINGIQFKCSSGNIDSGVIKLYGVS